MLNRLKILSTSSLCLCEYDIEQSPLLMTNYSGKAKFLLYLHAKCGLPVTFFLITDLMHEFAFDVFRKIIAFKVIHKLDSTGCIE